jgi:hypothetical protein
MENWRTRLTMLRLDSLSSASVQPLLIFGRDVESAVQPCNGPRNKLTLIENQHFLSLVDLRYFNHLKYVNMYHLSFYLQVGI